MKKENLDKLDELVLRMKYALKEASGYDLASVYISSDDVKIIEALRDELTGEGKRMTKAECQAVVDEYNRICTSLPLCKALSETRQKALAGAKKLLGDVTFTTYFKRVEDSDFLTGRDGRWQGCGFDWILKKANLLKVMEGNYDNKGKKVEARQESSFDIDEFFQAALRRTEREAGRAGTLWDKYVAPKIGRQRRSETDGTGNV